MIGYTRKVGLRKPAIPAEVLAKIEELRGFPYRWHGDAGWIQDLLERVDRESARAFGRPAAQLGEPTDKSLPEILGTTDEAFLESMHNSLERLRHRERHPCPDMSCPHCPCTYSTECCYCDGSRTPLECVVRFSDLHPLWVNFRDLTLIERPRRKLRVGSVWERWGVHWAVGTNQDVEELEREAQA